VQAGTTGGRRAARVASRGYTLLELVIVLLLLGLLGAITLMAGGLMFRDTEQLKQVSRELAGFLENVRTNAAFKGSKYVVEYSLDDDNQGYFAWVPYDGYEMPGDSIFEEDEQGFRVAGGFHQMPTRYRANRTRYYAVWIDRIAFGDGSVVNTGQVRVDFRPRGGSHWHYIYLTNMNGDFYTIEINPFTGAADIYPGELVPDPPEELR
jgi:prepilin-type N-terminal cleavage/methylation domain-containing protein